MLYMLHVINNQTNFYEKNLSNFTHSKIISIFVLCFFFNRLARARVPGLGRGLPFVLSNLSVFRSFKPYLHHFCVNFFLKYNIISRCSTFAHKQLKQENQDHVAKHDILNGIYTIVICFHNFRLFMVQTIILHVITFSSQG